MTDWFFIASAAIAVLVAVCVRAAFIRRRGTERVDEFYWRLVARAARKKRRPPFVLPGKYILETDEQYYPPLFGILLSLVSDQWLKRRGPWFSHLPDAALIVGAIFALGFLGVGAAGTAAAIIVLALAPAWTVYNAQLNPRSWGNLFFAASMMLQVAGHSGAGNSETMWGAAIVLTALVVLTHKMTTQVMLALWPFWVWALGSWEALLIPPAGILIAGLMTGLKFAVMQWRAHWDVVSFWGEHWPNLGRHAFRHSPVYGDPGIEREQAYHRPGFTGIRFHTGNILGYAPFNIPLAALLLVSDAAPNWLLVWFFGIYAWAFATAFLPSLKRYGGGHLYAANAVIPGVIGWGIVINAAASGAELGFLVGLALTAFALWIAWRRSSGRQTTSDAGISALTEYLRGMTKTRVAVFPLTAAETIAFETDHSVLWGAHSYGFKNMPAIFPIISEPLAKTLALHQIDWIAWNAGYWPGGFEALTKESVLNESPQEFGDWRLGRLRPDKN